MNRVWVLWTYFVGVPILSADVPFFCATKYSACDCYFDSRKSCFKFCAAQDCDELRSYAESAFSCFKQSNWRCNTSISVLCLDNVRAGELDVWVGGRWKSQVRSMLIRDADFVETLVRTHFMCGPAVGHAMCINPYPTAFPYGNGVVLHFYQQQGSSTTKTVHKVINKGLKAYV